MDRGVASIVSHTFESVNTYLEKDGIQERILLSNVVLDFYKDIEIKGSSIILKYDKVFFVEIQCFSERLIVKNVKQNTFDTEVKIEKIHKEDVNYENLFRVMERFKGEYF